MISYWREELQKLAEVECKAGAISFYFFPQAPQNKAHRDQAILVKDLLRDASRRLEREGGGTAARKDLERIGQAAEQLAAESRPKAIFACAAMGVWREFDLPSGGGRSEIHVNARFHLRPLAKAAASDLRCVVLLVNREDARVLEVAGSELVERAAIHDEVPRRVRTQGF